MDGNSLVKDNFLRFYGIQQLTKKEVVKYNRLVKTIANIRKIMSNEGMGKQNTDEAMKNADCS